jgi:hypothetical protein
MALQDKNEILTTETMSSVVHDYSGPIDLRIIYKGNYESIMKQQSKSLQILAKFSQKKKTARG